MCIYIRLQVPLSELWTWRCFRQHILSFLQVLLPSHWLWSLIGALLVHVRALQTYVAHTAPVASPGRALTFEFWLLPLQAPFVDQVRAPRGKRVGHLEQHIDGIFWGGT